MQETADETFSEVPQGSADLAILDLRMVAAVRGRSSLPTRHATLEDSYVE